MRCAWWAAAVSAAVMVGTMVATASEPTRARSAQAACADLSPVTDYNTFVLGDHRVNNNRIYGRAAIGGRASLNELRSGEVTIGLDLPSGNVQRPTLIVRGDIDAPPGYVDVRRGGVLYAGTLRGSVSADGPVQRVAVADLPFDFDDTFARLNALQETWADLPDPKPPQILSGGEVVRFVGTDRRLNVFTVSAATLQDAATIQIGVPGGRATTLINVTGATYTSAQRPTDTIAFNTADPVVNDFEKVGSGDVTSEKGLARARVVWNFHEADEVQIGTDDTSVSSMSWEGTVFAPKATVLLGESARLHGTIIAGRLEQTGTARLPTLSAAACLPPSCGQPGPDPDPDPDPEPEPPPLPSDPIPPAPPGTSRLPDTGDVAGQLSGSTRLALCKRRSRARVTAGRTVRFRLEVRNVGLATARQVVVCDPLPAGLLIVRARGAQVRGGRACWRIDSLRDERTMHLTARANLTATGVFRNVARARAPNARTARGRARIRVLAADPFDGRPPAKGAQAERRPAEPLSR